LLDPDVLVRVLGLDEPPVLRLGITVGFHFETWRGSTALVRGPAGTVVHGAVYDGVVNEELERRLQAHMTEFFKPMRTFVRPDQDFVVDGRSFVVEGVSFVAKVFHLRKNDIRYAADGTPYVRESPWRTW
jgi:hypothetical protein